MTRFLLVVSIAAVNLTAVRADEKADLARFQGTWLVTKAVRNGVEAPDIVRDVLRVTVAGRKLTIQSAEDVTTVEDELALDPSKTPAEVNLKPILSKKPVVLLGIYQFNGETLRMCWAESGGPRPAQFASAQGGNAVYVELKKAAK